MEKLQKYFLSILTATIIFACNPDVSIEERKAKADEMINRRM